MTSGRTYARRIIRTLRSGVADPHSALAISVGTGECEARLSAVFETFAQGAHSRSPVLVVGEWGAGKSHIGMLSRGAAARHHLAWASAAVDGKGGSLSHIHRSVPSWLEGVQTLSGRGLRAQLESGGIPTEAALEWAKGTDCRFARALAAAILGSADGWLTVLGLRFASPDYPYQHHRALELFIDAARFLKAMRGFGGVVLLLDEAENICREHDIRGRRRAYETLEKLATSGCVLPVLFVTSRFYGTCDGDRVRCQQRGWDGWPEGARNFLEKVEHASGRSIRVPRLDRAGANQLVTRLVELHAQAYSTPPALIARQILEEWESTLTKSARLLVRMTISRLDLTVESRDPV